jgi:nitroreductase
LLAACENGLASVWIGAFDEEEVRKILQLPNSLKPVSIVPIGYPNEYPSATPRCSLREMVIKSL